MENPESPDRWADSSICWQQWCRQNHEPLCASSTTLLEAGLNGKLPTVPKKVCYLSRVGRSLRSGPQGRGSRHYFFYSHCYSEKKSGKRPSGTSGKGTEAWKAAGCTRPALLEPVFQRNREKINTPRSLVLGRTLCLWFRMVHRLQAHS
ncbi:hypothetical protein QOT17_012671 [Balamuthia mandrillaris]